MNRAYSILNVKTMDAGDDEVVIEGVASTPRADRMGDVVEPKGARFKTPMPLLWQHNHDQPVGHVTFAKATDDGIPFTARLPVIREAGRLKDRVDEAIQSLKYNLVSAVSIGFLPNWDKTEQTATGFRFTDWEWTELSLVTIPANSDALVSVVRSLDAVHRPPAKNVPGASGVVKLIRKPRGTQK